MTFHRAISIRGACASLFLAFLPGLLAAQTSITAGRTVNASLTNNDPTLDDESHYDLYEYRGRAGEQLRITMRSRDFDTFLAGGVMQGGTLSADDSNDDGGGGTDSQLDVTVGASGVYVIRANSLEGGETGEYTLLVEVLGGGGAVSAAPTQASGPSISAGQTVSGRLEGTDPTLADGSHFDIYVYRGTPGEQVTVIMRSADFDAFLAGGTPRGSDIDAEDSDDDGAGGTNAMLSATVPASGVYGIRANSLRAGVTGAYTLTLQAAGATASGPRTVRVGETVAGRLAASTPTLGDGSHYDTYYIDARAGDRLFVTMTSGDFDTYLRWGREQGGGFESLGFDDDGAGGTNSRLEIAVEAAGRYAIQANSYGADATGAYTLEIESASGGTAGLPAVALGQTVAGRLDATDPLLGDNSHYEIYAHQGRPGEQVLVTMRSADFDAFLAVGRIAGGSFEATETNDDSGGGTDSQILATLGGDGTLAIRANSLRAGQTGAFTLNVAPASGAGSATPANVPTGARVVAAGQSIEGALSATDPMMADSSYYNDYVYSGTPGDRVRVTLTSSAFDAFLQWGRVSGDRFTSDAHDDDGAGGMNAQVEATVDGSGTYAIRVNSYGPGETGAYTLTVERLTGAAAAPAAPVSGSAGKWHFAYVDSPNPEYRPLGQLAKQWGVLEQITADMAGRFLLPRDIDMTFDECGMINAFYNPNETSITFCYELLALLADTFVPDGNMTQAAQDQVSGAIWFIIMHEVGHALVDVLDLPITGREEDVADQLAVVTLMEAGEKGAEAAYAGTLALQPATSDFEQYEFADEHSLGPVRLFNVLCWIYGSDPSKYSPIVNDGHLPEERAVRCPGEWDRMAKSWERLLQPYAAQ